MQQTPLQILFVLIKICFGVVFTTLNDKLVYFVSSCSCFVKKSHEILTILESKKAFFSPNM
jgi:hypothetical protein